MSKGPRGMERWYGGYGLLRTFALVAVMALRVSGSDIEEKVLRSVPASGARCSPDKIAIRRSMRRGGPRPGARADAYRTRHLSRGPEWWLRRRGPLPSSQVLTHSGPICIHPVALGSHSIGPEVAILKRVDCDLARLGQSPRRRVKRPRRAIANKVGYLCV